jgi:hypothetical protein
MIGDARYMQKKGLWDRKRGRYTNIMGRPAEGDKHITDCLCIFSQAHIFTPVGGDIYTHAHIHTQNEGEEKGDYLHYAGPPDGQMGDVHT